MLDYALYIGRFQPFHNGHLASVKYGLSIAKKLIIILGGYRLSPSSTDPWDTKDRKQMIIQSIDKKERTRVLFLYIRDRLYNEELWKENVVQEVQKIIKTNSKIALLGHMKDDSSYYLKIFPQWQFIECGNFYHLNGTQLREKYFLNQPIHDSVPNPVQKFLKTFQKKKLFKSLQEENHFLKSQEKTHNPIQSFICIRMGHYLCLKKRSTPPGKHLYSLPNIDEVQLSAQFSQFFLKKQNFYKKKYDANTNGKEVFFYRAPFFAISTLNLQSQKNLEWLLIDDLYLMEDTLYADHYQMISTLFDESKFVQQY